MKALTICFLSCLLFITSKGQFTDSVKYFLTYNMKKSTEKDLDYSYYRTGYKTQTGTWWVKDYYVETRRLKAEGEYVDDSLEKQDGLFRYYHRNGMLAKEGMYNKGKKVGLWKEYNDKGRLTDSGRYKSTGMPIKKHYRWSNEEN